MAYYKVYLENGKVFVESSSAGASIITTDNAVYPSTMQFPANSYLTSTVVNTNNLRIVTATGNVVFNDIPYTDIKRRTGASYGVSAGAVNSALNSIFNYSFDYESNIAEILKPLKVDKSGNQDRGVFYNDDKTKTDSFLSINTLAVKLQAGAKTNIGLEESSPGTIELNVASGSSGNEVETLALSLAGDTAGRVIADLYGVVSLKGWSTGTAGSLVWYEASTNGVNTITLSAPASVTGSQAYVWPTSAGTTGKFLQLGNSGQLGWATADNYSSWNLKTNGIQRTTVQSGGSLDIVAGTNITTSYSAGGVVTIASGATANQTDAYLLDRTNHTGSQLAVTISDFVTQVNTRIGLSSITDLSDTMSSLVANYILRVNNTATAVTVQPKRIPYTDEEVETDQNRIFEKTVTTTSNRIVDFMNDTLAARNNANAKNMLGFYDGTNKIVLEGMVDAGNLISGASAGAPLWLGASGAFSATAPTTATEYSRIVGYYIGTGQGQTVLVYFNPSRDWVQID